MKQEFVKRSLDVQEKIANGEFEHDDLVMYTIQLSANRQHKRSILKKNDFKDVQSRVLVQYPEGVMEIPEEKKLESLPLAMASLIASHPKSHWKIEWMYKGGYVTMKSDMYKDRFGTNKTSRKDLYAKIVDTMGFSHWEVAYKMWVESIRCPGQIIKYEGLAYHLDTKSTKTQTAKMMTVVVDYQHMITLTVIN